MTYLSTGEIILSDYRFWKFELSRSSVIFCIAPYNDRRSIQEDEEKIKAILSNLGNWERLVKTGLYLLSDLKIIQLDQKATQEIEEPFGTELYEIKVAISNADWKSLLFGAICLTSEERERRKDDKLNHDISVKEITNQLNNIPKWQSFEKTLKTMKAIFS